MLRRIATLAAILLTLLPVSAFAQPAAADGIARLLASLERVVQDGTPAAYEALLARSASRPRARDFAATEFTPGTTRATVHERDRGALPGVDLSLGRRLLVEALIESGPRARIATWRLDVRRPSADVDDGWQIADEERLTVIESLYRLSLDVGRQFDARNLSIAGEDLDVSLPHGSVFIVPTDQGVTGLVLLGRGTMKFHPAPETEKGQVRIFCGADALEAEFDAAFLRLNPGDYDRVVDGGSLVERPVDQSEWRRADEVFRAESPKSFALDLGDMSSESWWMLPQPSDFLAEIRTRRYGTLTYARSTSDPEDVSLFDRKRKRNISVYSSRETLARRGPFYNEDDQVDYDVLEYDLDVSFLPERSLIDGFARLRLKIRAAGGVSAITLRLANPLEVRAITSLEYGRLLSIRVRDQNSIVVNLPVPVPQDAQVNLAVSYSGRLEPQTPDSETAGQLGQLAVPEDEGLYVAEPSYVYSNRSYWYPQSTVSDYATGVLRITIPATYDCVASGELLPDAPALLPATTTEMARKFYVFTVTRPSRYLGVVISRFIRTATATVVLTDELQHDGEPRTRSSESLRIAIETNKRVESRARTALDRAVEIAQFYTSLVGDCPYPTFTAAIVERDLPGGHSPPSFAVVDQPAGSRSPSAWRNDPASFPTFPEFFLAHEMAHQWWGQAVGWRNYHEQWLSEAFAQYFAAMYAERHGGPDVFDSLLRQFRRWTFADSSQGPVYLGYRLGHIKGDSRVFRAVLYNKGAGVLHMLRRLLGDDAFLRGIRRFYRESRFEKAGTEDLRLALEAESGRSLGRFFEKWIYGSTLPRLKFSYRTESNGGSQDLVLHAEQLDDVFDVPLTLRLEYAGTLPADVIVMPVTDRVVDMRVHLSGPLRGVTVRMDEMLADVSR